MGKFYTALVKNTVFANVVLFLLLSVGALAMFSMPRESEPEMNLPIVRISIPYPGADPEEVEEAITQKVEAAVDGLEGVELYQSTSMEGMSRTDVQVAGGYDMNEMRDMPSIEVL